MPIKRVGLNFDGSTVHVTVGKIEIPVISATYGDNLKSEWVYRLGTQIAEDDTPGQYETEEGTLKMSDKNYRLDLMPALAKYGAGNTRVKAVITRTHPEMGTDSDALLGFRVMGAKSSPEAGAKGLEIEIKTRYRVVQWTNARKVFGNPTGTGAVGRVRI
jgi:hypothetical protein